MPYNLEFGENNRLILFKKADLSIVKIKPTNWINIDDTMQLLETLLTEYVKHDGLLGNIFRPSNTTTWTAIESLLNYHQLVGGERLHKKDLEHLDIEELKNLFITTNVETSDFGKSVPSEGKYIDPCMLSVINSLDFFEILRKALENKNNLTEQI